MNRKVVIGFLSLCLTLSVAFVGLANAASIYHKYIMSGSILEVSGQNAYLCIGSAEGAKVGQVLTVYNFKKKPASQMDKGVIRFDRVKVGKIKITKIVDQHMADAKILSGNVQQNDIAQLRLK